MPPIGWTASTHRANTGIQQSHMNSDVRLASVWLTVHILPQKEHQPLHLLLASFTLLPFSLTPKPLEGRWPGSQEQGSLCHHTLTGSTTEFCSKFSGSIWTFPMLLSFLLSYRTLNYQTIIVFQNLKFKSRNILHQGEQTAVAGHGISEYEASGPRPPRRLSPHKFWRWNSSVCSIIFSLFLFSKQDSCSPGWPDTQSSERQLPLSPVC